MSRSSTTRLRRSVLALAAASIALIGCSSDDTDSRDSVVAEAQAGSISISIARAPIPEPEQTSIPVYGILVNDSPDVMRVISATSPEADSVDLLGPDDSTVLPAEGLVVQSDGGLVMEPVGFKLMLNGVDPDALGAEIPVTLRFESGATFDFSAVLQERDL